MTNEDSDILEISNKHGTTIEYPMIWVPPGSFMMGHGKYDDSKPVHEVEIKRGFYIGKYPVTQALWKAVMGGDNPSRFKGDSRPVETVSWDNIQNFILKLNNNKKPKNEFRLLTESEWEYAARGGKEWVNEKLIYAGSNRLEEVGWFGKNSMGSTKPVGLKMANQLGIHDMSGNVWEWCQDDWADNYQDHPTDGTAYEENKGNKNELRDKVVRGGSWDYVSVNCTVFYRGWRILQVVWDDSVGFRLARY